MTRTVDDSKWEWWATIRKTNEPGGAWLFEFHGGWHGTEDDTQAFRSLAAAKKYGQNSGDMFRYVQQRPDYWMGYLRKAELAGETET